MCLVITPLNSKKKKMDTDLVVAEIVGVIVVVSLVGFAVMLVRALIAAYRLIRESL